MRLLVFPLIGLLLLMAIGWENRELFNDRQAIMYMYIDGVKAGLGYGIEETKWYFIADLEPGILYWGLSNGLAGFHAGLYMEW